ncbi:MAG: MucBP domain-containing protein [uncultured Clostridium sp.]
MSTLYEVSSLTAIVMNKPNIFSQVLGRLNKGDQIDVISISKSWAYFKYNNINAYVKKENLKVLNTEQIESKGSVTLKYIDITSNNEIYPSETINNLELGNHSYEARIIYNYKLQNDSTQSVNLTVEDPNQIISFYYNQILGTITIKYIDINVNSDIYESKIIENLSLGTYTYGAINISGYVLSDNEIKTVTITETTPNATITFKYTEILGTVTIKYIDSSSLNEIGTTTVISNLSLETYSYTAKSFEGYEVIGDSSQSVTLNDSNLNPIISFNYSRISGNITIQYLDSSDLAEIAPSTTISNIALGSYTYDAIYIDNYEIDGDSSISITLTTTNPNQTISFKYNKIEIPDDLNWNEVPYISTYYIKPVVKPGEEVFINYYITDYYYKEYMEKYNLKNDEWGDDNWTEEIWNNETFTVTIRIEGQDDKLYHYLRAGDHKVSLGSFSTEGEQKFSILCTDKYGRNSHELFNFFLVQDDIEIKEYVMTEDDLVTYNIKNTDDYEIKKIINLSSLTTKNSTNVKTALVEAAANIIPSSKTYVCVIADTTGDGTPNNWWAENQVVYASDYDKDAVLQEAINTRKGLQQLLDDKKNAGYNRLTLLPGIYRIDHQQQIYIPTEFTLDMNGATFKQNQFTGDSSTMISLTPNAFDSHLINGVIIGDYFSHDYSNSNNNSEWVNGLGMTSCSYSSFENIKINDVTGYGCATGRGDRYYNVKYVGTTSLGDIDRKTGANIESSTRTVSDFADIGDNSKLDYITISRYLGYQGRSGDCWNIIVHFYDEAKKYIKSIDSYQYRRIRVPNGSKYIKVTLLSTTTSSDLAIYYFSIPCHCNITNIEFNNIRAVGLAQSAMNDMLVSENSFTNCGQSSAKCAYDAEDGWDMMQDVTFKNNKFNYNPNNHFLTCAGHNFIIDGQEGGKIYIWNRTRSLVVKNCSNLDITLQGGGKENIIGHGIYKVFNNIFTKGNVANNLSKNNTVIEGLGGLVYNSILGSLGVNKYVISGSIYKNCTINPASNFLGYISNITMIDCNFNPTKVFITSYSFTLNNGSNNTRYFESCNFYGTYNLGVSGGSSSTTSTTFKNCYFENSNVSIDTLRLKDGDLTLFENCNFNYKNNNFIYVGPNAYDTGFFDTVKFNNCTINMTDECNNSFIYCNAKPNGNFIFNNCKISIPSSLVILDGYKSNIDKITNLNILFENSPLPLDITLLSDYFKTNTNLKITIS